MQPVELISSRLTEYIQARPSKTAPGTEIAQFIRFAFPGFSPLSYGTPKLHQFLNRFIREVIPVGKSGGDLVYGIRESQMQLNIEGTVPPAREAACLPEAQPPTMNRQLWKSFSSPNSLWVIYANPETGEVEVVPPGGPKLAVPWVVIPPCSAEQHRQIAERFVAARPDDQRQVLNGVLSQPRWWDQMYAVTLRINLFREWQAFRRRELQKLLSEALAEAKIPAKSALFTQANLSRSHQAQPATSPTVDQTRVADEELLRRAVISVVQKMSISELRNLAIPVGNLMDELRRGT